MSAQLLFDVLGDQAVDFQQAEASWTPVETHLQAAHETTGLNSVHSRYGLSGSGQTVALIDSGIAWDHVSLGKGFGPGYRVVGGWDFAENDDQPYDEGPAGFHGTHVSGIVGSQHSRYPGVAPGADLVALRVFDDMGVGRLEWIENALRWVGHNQHSFEHPITTVNLSIGTDWHGQGIPDWAVLEDELEQLYNNGILITASAGNSFQELSQAGLSYPASSPFVLPVASVGRDGTLSDFSQRIESVLAAPGESITSTIPDHVLGRDGIIDDFSAASGTSMAAPYAAGASILVRQAMEMAGWENSDTRSIIDHLQSTADTETDHQTGVKFARLNLERAVDTIIPADQVGDTSEAAARLDLTQSKLDVWINELDDTDAFQFASTSRGVLKLNASSPWIDSAQWHIAAQGETLVSGGMQTPASIRLEPGESYQLYVSGGSEIGPLSLELDFQQIVSEPPLSPTDLGTIRYAALDAEAGSLFTAQAAQDGIFTVQWTHPHDKNIAGKGGLSVIDGSGQAHVSNDWKSGTIRLDVSATAGERLTLRLPETFYDSEAGTVGEAGVVGGDLVLANVLQPNGNSIRVSGTHDADNLTLNLQDGLQFGFGDVVYSFPEDSIDIVHLDAHGNNDRLVAIGSASVDKVDLRPTTAKIISQGMQISIDQVEQISFESGGGADRVYMYDSDTDDALIARPRHAELTGVGYRFEVHDVSRIFMHSTGGGQDLAYLYDSPDDDRLSLRPQFSSLAGDDFFNYVRGFERVHAYANAGGIDTAVLYDSEGDDRFFTSGASASLVGPGFSSLTRSFEQVDAFASAGGDDLASLYGADDGTGWRHGSDFVSFHGSDWTREARGFNRVDSYVDGQAIMVASVFAQPVGLSTLADTLPPFTDASELPPPLPMTGEDWPLHFAVRDTEAMRGLPAVGIKPGPEFQPTALAARSDWGELSLREAFNDKLHLPEESLLADEQLERSLMDEAFRQLEETVP